MSDPNATILTSTTNKGNNMTIANKTYEVGDLFTTLSSGVTGTITEIVKNTNGSVRVKLDTEGGERWTTVSADSLS